VRTTIIKFLDMRRTITPISQLDHTFLLWHDSLSGPRPSHCWGLSFTLRYRV